MKEHEWKYKGRDWMNMNESVMEGIEWIWLKESGERLNEYECKYKGRNSMNINES